MRQCTLKFNLVFAVSLALFHAFFQIQGFSMYRNEEMQRHAYFIKHPSSVLSVPSKILSSSVSTSLECAFNCLETASCLSYNFGIHSKLCQLLATDKYNSSEKFEPSQVFDHHSIATPCVYQPSCVHLGRCQPFYASNDSVCVSPVIRYYLGEKFQSCHHICGSHHLLCVETGGFPSGNAVDIFKELGVECGITDDYWAYDQPCYAKDVKWCYGAKRIPNKISCERPENPRIIRLCPCQ